MVVPARIFIVPYRDRATHRRDLLDCLNKLLDGEDDWEIFFVHQQDARPFNRGAMKNIGFLVMRDRYPDHYRNITFIFHDVDTRPRYRGQFPYDTTRGVVAHYHGTYYALGGAFAIKGGDFERTLGFPNFWGWGLEDNTMQDRCIAAGLRIDRRNFVPLRDPGVARAFDGYVRMTSKHEAALYKYGTPDDIRSIRGLQVVPEAGGMLNVTRFEVGERHDQQPFETLDIRGGTRLHAERRFVELPRPRPSRTVRSRPRRERMQSRARPDTLTTTQFPCLRGRKRIKAPASGVIRRWPPR